ncbi:MAG: ParB/RepB/Spo0J family partition protein [Planctomycetota bacterium]
MAKQARKPVRKLGRGLRALLDETPAPSIDASPYAAPHTDHNTNKQGTSQGDAAAESGLADGSRLLELPIASLRPSRYQAREKFDDDALSSLAASIRVSGVMQPIVARPLAEADGGATHEIVAGERRWRAAKLAGLEAVPVVVRAADEESSATLGLIENLQRQDLDPVERARGLRVLKEQFGLSKAAIAERTGMDRSSVSNLLRILDLSDDILQLVQAGDLSLGHAKVLLTLEDTAARSATAASCAGEQWSVRRLEDYVRSLSSSQTNPTLDTASASPSGSTESASHPDARATVLADLERKLGDALGTKVAIRTDKSGARGTLAIKFFSLDHFETVVQSLGVNIDTH